MQILKIQVQKNNASKRITGIVEQVNMSNRLLDTLSQNRLKFYEQGLKTLKEILIKIRES